MAFTHKRSHGGRSSAALVNEAVQLHGNLCRVLARTLVSNDEEAKGRAIRLVRRAYQRYLRRDVRLAIQEGR